MISFDHSLLIDIATKLLYWGKDCHASGFTAFSGKTLRISENTDQKESNAAVQIVPILLQLCPSYSKIEHTLKRK